MATTGSGRIVLGVAIVNIEQINTPRCLARSRALFSQVAYAVRAGDVDTHDKFESINIAVVKELCKMVKHDRSEEVAKDVRSNVFSLQSSKLLTAESWWPPTASTATPA